ncbi:MAG: toxin-antitoxin system, toxin component, PIN family protein [Acidobacteria bacterium]|nr:MAG: toxin-antitoxin system, toxin component, PIN family protein [Acidobacteriota bacterium]
MKLLLDTCVWGGVRSALQAAGYDVVWAGDWPEDPGDQEILARAYEEGRILVTLDKDFGELAIVRGTPHCGILRLVNLAARQQAAVCMRMLALYGKELQSGAIVTAEPGRLRIRPPDVEEMNHR